MTRGVTRQERDALCDSTLYDRRPPLWWRTLYFLQQLWDRVPLFAVVCDSCESHGRRTVIRRAGFRYKLGACKECFPNTGRLAVPWVNAWLDKPEEDA